MENVSESGAVVLFVDIAKWIHSLLRNRVLDKKEKARTVADELESLADLLTQVLEATGPDGEIEQAQVAELDRLRHRNWNRWASILGSDGFGSQDPETQAEIERCVKIAHAAPGAYVDEILKVQEVLAGRSISPELRERFANSIDRIRDAVTRLRLNA